MTQRRAVLSDFDGTMTDQDGGELILRRFARGDWEKFDRLLEERRISLEECLKSQFALVNEEVGAIQGFIEPKVTFRPGVREVVERCRALDIPFVVVSGGLSFVIRPLLAREGILGLVELFAPTALWTPEGIRLDFGGLPRKEGLDFKSSILEVYRQKGFDTTYIGDGLSDLQALSHADHRFAIGGSELAILARKQGIAFNAVPGFEALLE
jgi:2-hydroxy-3-keto-5-methylthiopentenyl-1-phosphate phosphatase